MGARCYDRLLSYQSRIRVIFFNQPICTVVSFLTLLAAVLLRTKLRIALPIVFGLVLWASSWGISSAIDTMGPLDFYHLRFGHDGFGQCTDIYRELSEDSCFLYKFEGFWIAVSFPLFHLFPVLRNQG